VPKEQTVRKASDNKYLHRHFHTIMNMGLEYLRAHYGEESVEEYLQQYANAYYGPLKRRVAQEGLPAVMDYYRGVYEAEEAAADITFSNSPDELVIHISRCPAVTHMRQNGVAVSPLYAETARVIGETLCGGTPFEYALVSYRQADGASVQRFYRKAVAE